MAYSLNLSNQSITGVSHENKIFFVAILRNEEVLVKFAQMVGNYDQVLTQVLSKIVKTNGIKMTFNYENFCFHYIYDNTLIYFCVTQNVYDKNRAFKFLEHIKNKFESQYQRRVHTALPFAFHAEFQSTLALETKRYSENFSFDKLNEVQNKIDETKQILCEDIDKLTDRGEKLSLLVDKSDQLSESAISFKTSSRNLATSMFLKNIRFIIGLIFLLIIVSYLITSLACGGLLWQHCV